MLVGVGQRQVAPLSAFRSALDPSTSVPGLSPALEERGATLRTSARLVVEPFGHVVLLLGNRVTELLLAVAACEGLSSIVHGIPPVLSLATYAAGPGPPVPIRFGRASRLCSSWVARSRRGHPFLSGRAPHRTRRSALLGGRRSSCSGGLRRGRTRRRDHSHL